MKIRREHGLPLPLPYACLLQSCIDKRGRGLALGTLVHAHMLQTAFKARPFLQTKLVIMYAKCGSLLHARRLFNQMFEPNLVSWNCIIGTYSSQEAFSLFKQMQMQRDQFTFTAILPACTSLQQGFELHRTIITSGFSSNVFVATSLLHMYTKCGSIEDARKVFDRMPQRTVVSWNAMIVGYARSGRLDDALKLFDRIPQRTVVSWTAMITAYGHRGHVDEAFELFHQMPLRTDISWTTMINACLHNGHVDQALRLFHEMPQQCVVSWSALIAGYAHNGLYNETLGLFQQMQLTAFKPNPITFASIIPVCASLAALHFGKEIHGHVITSGFQSDMTVGNAIIDMYAKCGDAEDACKMFDRMPIRNVVTWTAMIVGYAMHGYGKQALEVFDKMQNSGTKPNHVTFLGVLSACCHAGMVDAACRNFSCMTQDYQITPALEHYCCMVDLLGRAGHLEEAKSFIQNMPIKADAPVWGSLLFACRIHNNIHLGEGVAECLFESDPENAAPYVMLSNIYAARGRWDSVQKMRDVMKNKRVTKMPGCSWMEVNNKICTFFCLRENTKCSCSCYSQLQLMTCLILIMIESQGKFMKYSIHQSSRWLRLHFLGFLALDHCNFAIIS